MNSLGQPFFYEGHLSNILKRVFIFDRICDAKNRASHKLKL